MGLSVRQTYIVKEIKGLIPHSFWQYHQMTHWGTVVGLQVGSFERISHCFTCVLSVTK